MKRRRLDKACLQELRAINAPMAAVIETLIDITNMLADRVDRIEARQRARRGVDALRRSLAAPRHEHREERN